MHIHNQIVKMHNQFANEIQIVTMLLPIYTLVGKITKRFKIPPEVIPLDLRYFRYPKPKYKISEQSAEPF